MIHLTGHNRLRRSEDMGEAEQFTRRHLRLDGHRWRDLLFGAVYGNCAVRTSLLNATIEVPVRMNGSDPTTLPMAVLDRVVGAATTGYLALHAARQRG